MNPRLETPPLETIQRVSTTLFKAVQRMKLVEPDRRLIMRTLDTIRAAARILESEGLPKKPKAPRVQKTRPEAKPDTSVGAASLDDILPMGL